MEVQPPTTLIGLMLIIAYLIAFYFNIFSVVPHVNTGPTAGSALTKSAVASRYAPWRPFSAIT